MTGEELSEDDVLLRPAQQPRCRVPGQGRGLTQHPETEGLVGAGQRGGGRATQARGHRVAQPGGGHPGRGEEEAGVGREPRADRPHHSLHRDRALPRAGRAEHPDHRRVSADRLELGVVEHRVVGDRGIGSAEDEHTGIPSRRADRAGGARESGDRSAAQ